MKYERKKKSEIIWLYFEKETELCEQLERFINKEKIGSAMITGLGFANDIELQVYDSAHDRIIRKQMRGSFEITSLTGFVENGRLHLHGTFADTEMKGIGGHIVSCVIGAMAQLEIQKRGK